MWETTIPENISREIDHRIVQYNVSALNNEPLGGRGREA